MLLNLRKNLASPLSSLPSEDTSSDIESADYLVCLEFSNYWVKSLFMAKYFRSLCTCSCFKLFLFLFYHRNYPLTALGKSELLMLLREILLVQSEYQK